MQGRRSKSFKALGMALPIKKDIENTLNMLELQKRRFLAKERQEQALKNQIELKKKLLLESKQHMEEIADDLQKERRKLMSKPKEGKEMAATSGSTTFFAVSKKKKQVADIRGQMDVITNQILSYKTNTERTYDAINDSILKLKEQVDCIRKRSLKYKKSIAELTEDESSIAIAIEKMINEVLEQEKQSQDLKAQIMNYRQMNLKNGDEFKKSHETLTRSTHKEENERKRLAVSTRGFLGDEHRQQRRTHEDLLMMSLKSSGIKNLPERSDILANSLPIAKARVNLMIHKNKQKLKIAEDYNRFGESLENLFKIIKQYKGRDDVDYLADEFVKKEAQIQKLGEYIGKLEHRIVNYRKGLQKKREQDNNLEEELHPRSQQGTHSMYKQMSQQLKADISSLKQQSARTNSWLARVGEIVCPLAQDYDFTRSNAINVIGKLEQKLNINKAYVGDGAASRIDKKSASPVKAVGPLAVEPEELHVKYNQLMSYDKLRDFADDYIKGRRN